MNTPQPSFADLDTLRVGVIGARGYVGREMARLIAAHPRLTLTFASSRRLAGQHIGEVHTPGLPMLRYAPSDPALFEDLALDAAVLAMPDGASNIWLHAIERSPNPPRVVLDLSADHRFDNDWTYGLAESFTDQIANATRIANPGCYATAMHLALRPLTGLFSAPAHCFGVSGYSGAGAAPCQRNDPAVLRDNILPYALIGHTHEREAARHLNAEVRFAPSVAGFFRGVIVTALVTLDEPADADQLDSLYADAYANQPLVRFLHNETPLLSDVIERPEALVGALSVDSNDPRRVGVVCALDNLMKGAASQAIQNLNLAFGMAPTEGLQV